MAEEESQYPQNRRLGGPQSQCGHCEEEKTLDPDMIQAIDNSACTGHNYLIKHKVEVLCPSHKGT